jgi:hypothetical protein
MADGPKWCFEILPDSEMVIGAIGLKGKPDTKAYSSKCREESYILAF